MKKKLLTVMAIPVMAAAIYSFRTNTVTVEDPVITDPRPLAFPGAEGFGKYATGARGASDAAIYVVTNLNDSGPGSFRDAVSKSGRFVVFAVGGIINLKSVVAPKGNITIYGQTAPGKGVFFTGQRVSFSGANNSIVRHIRIRPGITDKNIDASGISNGKNIIFDHVSFAWSTDEVFSINWDNKGNEPDSITLQNCIMAQGLHRHNHSAGGLIQTGGKVSILNSLYISNKTRNPKVKGYNEFVNNVVYNWGNYGNTYSHTVSGDAYIMGGESSGTSWVNVINNYFMAGPLTPPTEKTPFSRGSGTFNMYTSGNVYDSNRNGLLDGTVLPLDATSYPGIATENFMPVPFTYPYSNPANILSAEDAYARVIKEAGATLPQRDDVDELLIDEVKSNGKKGIYVYIPSNLPLANKGLGTYPEVATLEDKDGDGIPDEVEIKMGLDPDNATDALAFSNTQPDYRNIEIYANEFVVPDLSLPVHFGSINANLKSNKLHINWTTNTESNNQYFDVEASADGKKFTVIGKVDTLAENGSSNTGLQYEFGRDISDIALGMSVGMLLLTTLGIKTSKRKKMLSAIIAVVGIATVITACAKADDLPINHGQDLFIRLVQVDKDNTKTYSKVIKVVKAD